MTPNVHVFCCFSVEKSIGDSADALIVAAKQHEAHDYLTLKKSTVASDAGRGLFARRDISKSENNGFLCFFFGKLLLVTNEEVGGLNISFS
jgi:hypothetical protein